MVIYTIGHSTHSWEKFVAMLKSFEIELLADIRSYPGSRYMPHFNRETMVKTIPESGMEYIHMPGLGGRRRNLPEIDESLTEGWKHIAFRNYSAYTLTEDYSKGLEELMEIAKQKTTCIMCAESVPWRCHRLLVSNSLSFKGFCVRHIMDEGKTISHEIDRYGAKTLFDGKNVIYPKPPGSL